ncbi:MAG: YfhL family 4Fe-4S dicluster ferredoxin [Dehalococcoidales bacterium]|nr:YfhL family 4Fe-4S dicluster ferredoxin [Dehalococcoidales bacterium]
MAYKITEECISCGACESECPNAAIKEGETTYVIDPEKCTECVGSFESSQCAEVCPVSAPQPDPDRKESRDALLARWKKLHPGENPKTT